MSSLPLYIDAFSSLHAALILSTTFVPLVKVEGKVKGYKAQYKAMPLPVEAGFPDLRGHLRVEEKSIASPEIRLTDESEKKFHEVWHRYLWIRQARQPGNSAVFTPDIAKPYFHMQHESFWWLVA